MIRSSDTYLVGTCILEYLCSMLWNCENVMLKHHGVPAARQKKRKPGTTYLLYVLYRQSKIFLPLAVWMFESPSALCFLEIYFSFIITSDKPWETGGDRVPGESDLVGREWADLTGVKVETERNHPGVGGGEDGDGLGTKIYFSWK